MAAHWNKPSMAIWRHVAVAQIANIALDDLHGAATFSRAINKAVLEHAH
jgi:hypothetical protein